MSTCEKRCRELEAQVIAMRKLCEASVIRLTYLTAGEDFYEDPGVWQETYDAWALAVEQYKKIRTP